MQGASESIPNSDVQKSEIFGDFDGGRKHGQGRMSSQDGGVYVGEWENGHRWGEGKMIFFPNRDVYMGEWKIASMKGSGVMNYANGDHYDGNWHNSKRGGLGKFTEVNRSH